MSKGISRLWANEDEETQRYGLLNFLPSREFLVMGVELPACLLFPTLVTKETKAFCFLQSQHLPRVCIYVVNKRAIVLLGALIDFVQSLEYCF